ncbi:MAG: hypothetical protein U1E48_05075 [Paracoccaceae bacterium]
MDKKPFFTFDLQSYDDAQVLELARFQKAVFQLHNIAAASNLKYTSAAANYIRKPRPMTSSSNSSAGRSMTEC